MKFIPLNTKSTVFLLGLLCVPSNPFAHEYWLEPETYQIESGKVKGYLRNGQNFKGAAFPFVKDRYDQFTITNAGKTVEVTNRTGNSPALDQKALGDGLNIISFQNRFDTLTFKKWDKFASYLASEGLAHITEQHKTRGLPETDFVEQYARCAKTLISVSNDKGDDQQTGLKIEFVAHQNPYTLSKSDTLTLTLNWEGKPLPNRQVKLFAFDGELEISKHMTNDNGVVSIPLTNGGKFMLSAVHMIAGDNDPDTEKAEWQSYWASLTFGIQGTDSVLDKAEEAN